MSEDILHGISLTSPVRLDTIFPFMRKALNPEPSSNAEPDRFDTLLAEFHVNPTEPTTVLDLGCGDLLLLQKILEQHPKDHHLLAPVSYLGLDVVEHKSKSHWTSLQTTRCATCFPTIDYRKLYLDETETLSRELAAHPKFDLIVLSNVLHELSPCSALALFEVLFGRLSPKGKLFVLDPDWSWCASAEAWEPKERKGETEEQRKRRERHLNDLRMEWETDAVWLSHTGAQSVLRALGSNAVVHLQRRPSMHLWSGLCPPKGTAALEDGRRAFAAHLDAQIESERARIAQLRHDLRYLFGRHSGLTGELLVKMFEFFAACASQCRRLEALKELSQ